MVIRHLFDTYLTEIEAVRGGRLRSRPGSGRLRHLSVMNSPAAHAGDFPPVMTLAELADWLGVPVQTLYDLRSQGRGPRAFRVGAQLRIRGEEARAWLARLEEEDGQRHEVER